MSLFESLADELGAVAGRIEREAGLRIQTLISDIERRDALRELRLERLERALMDKAATVKDGDKGDKGEAVIGPVGEPGPAGPIGPQGQDGPAGRDGADGKDADPELIGKSVAVEVEAPLKAFVVQEVDRVAQSIPKPADGVDGAPGATGAKGEDGVKGDTGAPGAVGARGEKGESGDQGPEGERGETGERGEVGERGEIGLKGDAVIGPQGPPGQAGKDGLVGEMGPAGRDGEPGETVVGPRGDKGEPGVDGIRGLPGDRGEPGEKGERGIPGIPGDRGEQGERGSEGLPGAVGDRGEPGEKGERGIPGDPGDRGEQGERGLEGPIGKLPQTKLWVPDQVHYEGDVVAFDGGTYQAIKDTGKAPSTGDWICLATAGRDGEDGRSLEVRGTFDPSADYKMLDVVAFNGGSFMARRDSPGSCPGPGWQLIASPGKQGQKGMNGQRGEAGLRGPEGPAGVSATIIGWTYDQAQYRATPVMSDGKDGPALELRALFEQFEIEIH